MFAANARMYSPVPEAAAAWRALFGWLASAADVPLTIVEHAPPAPLSALWARPDLAACFMCGWPLARRVADVVPLAAPIMRDARAGGRAVYWTDLVVRADAPFQTLADTFGHRLAYTVTESHSGYNAVRHHLLPYADGGGAPYRELVGPVVTPRGAALAVLEGRADIAPLDAYAHALMRRHDPSVRAGLRVIDRTAPTPAPPLVASARLDPAIASRLADALAGAAADPKAAPLLEALELAGFAAVSVADYAVTLDWERAAFDRGFGAIA